MIPQKKHWAWSWQTQGWILSWSPSITNKYWSGVWSVGGHCSLTLHTEVCEIVMENIIPALREHTALLRTQTEKLRVAPQWTECERELSSVPLFLRFIPISFRKNYRSSTLWGLSWRVLSHDQLSPGRLEGDDPPLPPWGSRSLVRQVMVPRADQLDPLLGLWH